MNLDQYQEISGISVASSQRARVAAAVEHSRLRLETMLGFTLDPDLVEENLYNEIGKTQSDVCCSDIDMDNLLEADEVVGAYRLYHYNPLDPYLHLDPFSSVHAVKLVSDSVTLRTFESDEYTVQTGRNGVQRYLSVSRPCWRTGRWQGVCLCNRWCVQLAVDADWLWPDDEDYPHDLLSVWADLVTERSDTKGDLRSQTVGTHSWTRFDRGPIGELPETNRVLRAYAGPYGSLSKEPVQ